MLQSIDIVGIEKPTSTSRCRSGRWPLVWIFARLYSSVLYGPALLLSSSDGGERLALVGGVVGDDQEMPWLYGVIPEWR